MSTQSDNNFVDRIGIWTSALCAVHCLSLPILLPILPIIGMTFFAQHWFEEIMIIMSILIGFWALTIGFFKYHRQIYPVYSLLLGGLVFWKKDTFGHDYEPLIVTLGALLIIAAHVMNIRLCRACRACDNSGQGQNA